MLKNKKNKSTFKSLMNVNYDNNNSKTGNIKLQLLQKYIF